MAESPGLWDRSLAALARRPAIAVAALFIGGIALHSVLPHYPLIFLIAAMAMAGWSFRFAGKITIALAIFCVSA